MFNYYVLALKKYADFNGCSSRAEYWWFVLANIIVSFGLGFLAGLTGSAFIALVGDVIYPLVLFVPGLSACTRRLHDMGRSGWNQLWAIVPIVGIILLIVWLCQPTQTSGNKYRA